MFRRLWMLATLLLLFACQLALTVAAPVPQTNPVAPATVKTDLAFFVHVNTKALRESALFVELKQTLAKQGLEKTWDEIERGLTRTLGFKLTNLDSVTVCAPVPSDEKFIAIITSSKPFDKDKTFRLGEKKVEPDADGFYKSDGILFHFPDEKTLVVLPPDLARQYLEGYAKDRKTWPFTAELTQAAAGHTLFAAVNMEKVPLGRLREEEEEMFGPLLKTRNITLTADLKGKELFVGARATYPSAEAARNAKETIQKFIGLAVDGIDKYTNSPKKQPDEFFSPEALQPILKEAHRAFKEVKVEVAESDVTLTGSYKANFDFPKLVPVIVTQIHDVTVRREAINNFRQCMAALHNYHSALDMFPIHGIGEKGVPLKKANEKPLLSWRVAILPYIDEGELYQQFKLDEPWDSEHNKKLIERMPKMFAPVAKPGKAGYTHMQMVIGPSAMKLSNTSITTFTDGTSNTIAIVEAAEPVIWTKPDDVMFPKKDLPKDFRKKFGGQFSGGFHVGLWDGSVRCFHDKLSDETLKAVLTPDGDEVLDKDW